MLTCYAANKTVSFQDTLHGWLSTLSYHPQSSLQRLGAPRTMQEVMQEFSTTIYFPGRVLHQYCSEVLLFPDKALI
jgi:hypothetical protein